MVWVGFLGASLATRQNLAVDATIECFKAARVANDLQPYRCFVKLVDTLWVWWRNLLAGLGQDATHGSIETPVNMLREICQRRSFVLSNNGGRHFGMVSVTRQHQIDEDFFTSWCIAPLDWWTTNDGSNTTMEIV